MFPLFSIRTTTGVVGQINFTRFRFEARARWNLPPGCGKLAGPDGFRSGAASAFAF